MKKIIVLCCLAIAGCMPTLKAQYLTGVYRTDYLQTDSVSCRYNTSGVPLDSTYYILDPAGKAWRPSMKTVHDGKNYETFFQYDTIAKNWLASSRTYTFTGPANGETSVITAHWDKTQSAFFYYLKQDDIINADSTMTSTVYMRDSATSTWTGSVRYTSGIRNKFYTLSENWSQSAKAWAPLYRSREFHDTGMTRTQVNEVYDSSNAKWIINYRHQFQYNASHKLIAEVVYLLSGNTLYPNSKTTYTPDPLSDTVFVKVYHWDNIIAKDFIIYNDGWKIIKGKFTLSGGKTYFHGHIIKGQKDSSMLYDTLGNFLYDYVYLLDTATKKWVPWQKYIRDYNTFGKIIRQADYSATVSGNWNEDDSATYSYDSSQRLVRIRSFSFDNGPSEVRFYYGAGTGIEKIPGGLNCMVYPNPFKKTVYFRVEATGNARASLSIYTLEGRCVYSRSGMELHAGHNLIDWEPQDALPTGMYIYRIMTSKGESGGKIMLER